MFFFQNCKKYALKFIIRNKYSIRSCSRILIYACLKDKQSIYVISFYKQIRALIAELRWFISKICYTLITKNKYLNGKAPRAEVINWEEEYPVDMHNTIHKIVVCVFFDIGYYAKDE